MRELPAGTVTLLFSDIEGSTRLLHELGDEGRAEVARRRGEAPVGELLFGRALEIFHALGDVAQIADCLEGSAALAAATGRMERAGRLVGAAQTLRSGSEIPGKWPERVPRNVPREARLAGERMKLDEAVEYALATAPGAEDG